jgi:hypothetical protein
MRFAHSQTEASGVAWLKHKQAIACDGSAAQRALMRQGGPEGRLHLPCIDLAGECEGSGNPCVAARIESLKCPEPLLRESERHYLIEPRGRRCRKADFRGS